ncbi:MAG TPA: putative peptidoglycan glycosyltransferase FtsW [Thermoanaerobaculia bacterium]|nr:putative peptidoglycan glycosyltransferase FtsW [Thermoanaerobaculia bacterium]HUM29347.1 putative peptidoglycan glycosyltransferase FtsW [Thermoanaerobaculia bacterium]HXK67593.1 putative peptidoglycan glycosyltransferase FtsW [Thermoanaerobaculia bacterium]
MARKLKTNRTLIVVIFLLLGIGLLTVASSGALLKGTDRNVFFIKQGAVALLGLILLFAAMRIPYDAYLRPLPVRILGGASVALLLLLFFLPKYKDAYRWIVFPGFTLQPSEFVKIFLLIYLAYRLPRIDFSGAWWKDAILPAVFTGLIVMEPDLGTAFIILSITGVMFFVAGLPRRYVLLAFTMLLLFLTAAIFSKGYRYARLTAFLNMEAHADKEAYQTLQAMKAIGSGKLMGKGVGGSTQKLYYLPQPHTDFAFAIVGEELGFVGAVSVLLLFGIFLWQGLKVSRAHPRLEGSYLAFGITIIVVFQALIHISVNLALMPTKGLALPFISYGGSSLLATCLMAGILLNISEERA